MDDPLNQKPFPHPFSRRRFVAQMGASLGALSLLKWPAQATDSAQTAGETLYNGILLPASWPPHDRPLTLEPIVPPYLISPPSVIEISLGRQLFVDNFLIQETTLKRTFHEAEYHAANPVLFPDASWEQESTGNERPAAMVYGDGVWYDPMDREFKMWYEGGYARSVCLATSTDGIKWRKPLFDVRPNTNIVVTTDMMTEFLPGYFRDSNTVWLDLEEPDPKKRYKMFLMTKKDLTSSNGWSIDIRVSPDGIHWGKIVAQSGFCSDRTTVSYNPFRKKWVYGLRYLDRIDDIAGFGRIRRYWENADVISGPFWNQIEETPVWCQADRLDPARIDDPSRAAQLYNLDCVAYESVMLGLFTIWRGQPTNFPKYNSVYVGFSRDGFHWDRTARTPLVTYSGRLNDWNASNIQSAGGCCLIVGDKLHFYVSGRAGVAGTRLSGFCTTGLATLRRDGFCSMDAGEEGATLLTRVVRFQGRHCFVNIAAPDGELRVAVLDSAGREINPFSMDNCQPVRIDSTISLVQWNGAPDLSALAGHSVRFRFHLRRGKLYSFWISKDLTGASHGFVAAGGPGFVGPTDTIGNGSPHLNVARVGQDSRLSFQTQQDRAYVVEYKDTLTNESWTPLSTVSGDATVKTAIDASSVQPQRFYRIRLE